MITSFSWRGFAVVAVIGAATASQAVVAFDNFGAGDTFQTGVAYTVSGPQSANPRWAPAMQFTSLATGMLDRITIPLGFVSGTNSVYVEFGSDGGDVVAGFVLSMSRNSLPTFGDAYAPQVLVNPFTDPTVFPNLVLHAGSKYWIGVFPSNDDTWAAWNLNSTGDSGLFAQSQDGGSTWDYRTNTRGAFRVEVFSESVPGPAACLPFALGLLAVRRRRK